ncbi:hypothetical protein L2E82_16911 [Cichorium intybus]|uniref:Uncharacterized protein n=1 Tax=Cichorium intybus TaxID=13427 RepID=A0ACB9F7A7_CICIN|nr:hypothetical protein L2E82_16911 [Cichorium intybus]
MTHGLSGLVYIGSTHSSVLAIAMTHGLSGLVTITSLWFKFELNRTSQAKVSVFDPLPGLCSEGALRLGEGALRLGAPRLALGRTAPSGCAVFEFYKTHQEQLNKSLETYLYTSNYTLVNAIIQLASSKPSRTFKSSAEIQPQELSRNSQNSTQVISFIPPIFAIWSLKLHFSNFCHNLQFK